MGTFGDPKKNQEALQRYSLLQLSASHFAVRDVLKFAGVGTYTQSDKFLPLAMAKAKAKTIQRTIIVR
ncbi:hypothetical protein Clacol_003178 [Clathrus columnatus]|uniref:Uncharacterized protein n=1 Tax=Clathrus columnatus TaxID=1419009 RepID=A0AAV5A654_9AGAM|nr:hypothetical protein Clacol_003178 [Clathrus columnatus]